MLRLLESGSPIEVTARWRAMWNGEVLPYLRGLALVAGRGTLLRRGAAGTVVEANASSYSAGRAALRRRQTGPFDLRVVVKDDEPSAVLLNSGDPEGETAGYVSCGSHRLEVPRTSWPLTGLTARQHVFVVLEATPDDEKEYRVRCGMAETLPDSLPDNVVWCIGVLVQGDGGWRVEMEGLSFKGPLVVTGRWTT